MDKETAIETALIVAFFTAILFLGPATASEHRLKHDYPVGYGASDSYQHQTRAQAVYDRGQYRNEAAYMMAGFKDIIGFYPPATYHATALLARTSGLPAHDALFLIVGLALALGAVIAYYFTRPLGKAVAVLALPLTLFITTGAPFLGAATFGQMPFALSSLFLIATAWAITKLSLPRGYLLAAAALAGSVMTHTAQTLFFSMFLGAFFSLLLISRAAKQKINAIKSAIMENKELLKALGITTAATLYFWPLFLGIWLKMQPYAGIKVETESASFPAATVHMWQEFGLFTAAIAIGLAATAFLAVQKRKELGRLFHHPKLFPLIFSAYMILVGFGTYAGFGLRSFQTRLYWPITLAPLAGFGVYQLLKLAIAPIRGKGINTLAIATALTIILSVTIVAAYYEKPSTGSMTKNHWEAMQWIANTAPEEAKVWVMYSHAYSQTSVLYNTKHVNYFLDLSEAINTIREINEKGTAGRMRQASVASDTGAGLPYRKGLLSFGQHASDTKLNGEFDVCSTDYYLIDLAFGEGDRALQQLNIYFIQKFLKANMTIEYKNDWVVVMKNNKTGGDCLAQ